MSAAFWTFVALVSHWRRHRASFATLMVGLAVATALWSGVQALNDQARQSYDRAARLVGEAGAPALVSARGAFVRQDHYVALRRAGFKVSPVLEGTVRIGGATYRLVGIEPLTRPGDAVLTGLENASDLEVFLKAPGQMLAAPQTLADLGAAEGARIQTDQGALLPPAVAQDTIAPGLVVVDIGVAQTVLGRPMQLSRMIAASDAALDAASLAAVVGDAVRIETPEETGDLTRLTESFHLNLTAFGLLAFIVGLFIVHASIGLAFEQRLGTVRTLRASGVSLTTLIAVLVSEVVSIALLAGAVGMVCGYLIAAALLPDVASSLRGIYGADVGRSLVLEPRWWVSGLGMALLGALIASAASLFKVARMPTVALGRPLAWREAHERQLRRQGAFAVLCLGIATASFALGEGLVAGFVVIAGVLLGAALLLPLGLAALLRLGEGLSEGALARWFWADTRRQLSGLSLALMALLLALAANIGVGTMVEGFRKTFTGWLDERLNSEIYFTATDAAAGRRVASWLEAQPDVTAVLPVWRTETRIGTWPVDIYGLRDHATYRDHFSLLAESADAWDRVHDGAGALVSEQLAQRLSLGVGGEIEIPTEAGAWTVPVVGVFADYGNPKGQVRVDVDRLVRHWPDARRTHYSVRTAPEAATDLIARMRTEFGDALAQVSDQAALKSMSLRIFERTFTVTSALNTLTLIVSGIALFASLLTLADMRVAQLAPVWALGVPRRRLADLEVGKVLVLAAMTATLAVPLGLLLAWCLVAIVNVQAFGWRLPFHVFPLQWATVLLLALVTAFVAAMLPVLRLARTAPADLLKVFANER